MATLNNISSGINGKSILGALQPSKFQWNSAHNAAQSNQAGIQAISIGQFAGLGSVPDHVWQESPDVFVKKYEVIETSEDVLALSAAWYRLRKDRELNGTPYVGISTLLDRELFRLVTPEDRVNAEKIRSYYMQKIIVWTLKEQRLSAFREDLKVFVNDNSLKTTEKMLPLAYRLPEFYAYDTEFDDMVRELDKGQTNLSGEYVLTALKCFKKNRRTIKKNEYWMKDASDHVYLINLAGDNPLLHMWEREFEGAASLTITGTTIRKRRDDLNYIQFDKWNLG